MKIWINCIIKRADLVNFFYVHTSACSWKRFLRWRLLPFSFALLLVYGPWPTAAAHAAAAAAVVRALSLADGRRPTAFFRMHSAETMKMWLILEAGKSFFATISSTWKHLFTSPTVRTKMPNSLLVVRTYYSVKKKYWLGLFFCLNSLFFLTLLLSVAKFKEYLRDIFPHPRESQ